MDSLVCIRNAFLQTSISYTNQLADRQKLCGLDSFFLHGRHECYNSCRKQNIYVRLYVLF